MHIPYGSYNDRICLWYDLWLNWKRSLVWVYQDHFTLTATAFGTDSFRDYEPCFQPVQNINTMVLHLISHWGVTHDANIRVCWGPRIDSCSCMLSLNIKSQTIQNRIQAKMCFGAIDTSFCVFKKYIYSGNLILFYVNIAFAFKTLWFWLKVSLVRLYFILFWYVFVRSVNILVLFLLILFSY